MLRRVAGRVPGENLLAAARLIAIMPLTPPRPTDTIAQRNKRNEI
jgi:hypothetical protein